MSTVKKLFSQSLVYGLSTVVPRLLNYFLVPLYTRVFLPHDFGVINEMYAYLGFFLVLLTFGLETGFFKFSSQYDDINVVYPTAFYFLLTSSLIAASSFILLAKPITGIMGSNYHEYYIIILGLVISIDAFSAIIFAKLRYLNKPFMFSIIKVSGVVINLILNIFFLIYLPKTQFAYILDSVDLIGLVFLANLISSLVTIILAIIITRIPKISIDKAILKQLIFYSLPLLIAGLGGTTNETFDRIFIRYLIPSEDNPLYQLGIYSSNVKLAVLLVLFIQMYRFAAEPFFFQNQKESNSKELFSKTLTAFVLFCFLTFLVVSLNLPILKLLVGKEFREQLFIVPVLLLANILYGTFFNFSFWYKLSGKTVYGIKYTFIGASITIISNIILIPLIGIYGAALSRVICYTVMNILSYVDGSKSGFIRIEGRKIVGYALLTLIIFIVGFSIYFYSQMFSVIVGNFLVLIFAYYIVRNEQIDLKALVRIRSFVNKKN